MIGTASWPGTIAPGQISGALTSSLDYFPTLSVLAGLNMPTDRSYDGIDISPLLLGKTKTAHTTLFHPNSGASGVYGGLDAVRHLNFKAVYQTGGAPACGGARGNDTRFDPPLLFDLDADPAGACTINRPCAQQYVSKSQSCMVISGRPWQRAHLSTRRHTRRRCRRLRASVPPRCTISTARTSSSALSPALCACWGSWFLFHFHTAHYRMSHIGVLWMVGRLASIADYSRDDVDEPCCTKLHAKCGNSSAGGKAVCCRCS